MLKKLSKNNFFLNLFANLVFISLWIIKSTSRWHGVNEEIIEKELIKNSNFFFIASSWNGYIDCNIKSGDSGFVKIIDNGTIEYPEYDGNSMYRTAGNIFKNPNVGLLFINFDGESRRIRINGCATIHHDNKTLNRHFGAKFVIRIKCEIYPNCPRYIPNLDAKKPSVYVPREGQGIPPAPEWKERDYIKNILQLRRKYSHDRQMIWFDIPQLTNPDFMNPKLYSQGTSELTKCIEFMERNKDGETEKEFQGFSDFEIKKVQRLIDWINAPTKFDNKTATKNFVKFFHKRFNTTRSYRMFTT